MPAMLDVTCPNCDKALKVPADLEGRRVKCKGCDEAFVVKVRVADLDALDRTLSVLRKVPGVARTRTTVVLSTRFEGRHRIP